MSGGSSDRGMQDEAVGIILLGHGSFARSLKEAGEHVVGPISQLSCVEVGPDDDIEMKRTELMDACRAVDRGKGVIVLTDMFGGSPSNLAISLMDSCKIEVLAGANLPVLVKIVSVRYEVDLQTCSELAHEAGRRYIKIASKELAGDEEPQELALTNERLKRLESVLLVTNSLKRSISEKLEELRQKLPNSEDGKSRAATDIQFLETVLHGLDGIAAQISKAIQLGGSSDSVRAVDKEVNSLAVEIRKWWAVNKADSVDLLIRIPAISGAIGLMNLAGANPMIATGAAVAAIGGPNLVKTAAEVLGKKG